jgi:hypothetical protein
VSYIIQKVAGGNLSSVHVRDMVFCAVYAIIAIAAVAAQVLA